MDIDYDEAFKDLAEAVFVHTLEEIKWCNEMGARLLGFDNPEALIGKSPFEFTSNKRHLDLMVETSTASKTRERGGFAVLNRRDGKEISVLVRFTYSRDSPNTLVTVVRPIVNVIPDRKAVRFIEAIRDEVRTPLAVIKGYIELMEKTELSGAQLKHFLSLIRENIDLMEASSEKIIAMEVIEESMTWTANAPHQN